jgi:hypothetical protein
MSKIPSSPFIIAKFERGTVPTRPLYNVQSNSESRQLADLSKVAANFFSLVVVSYTLRFAFKIVFSQIFTIIRQGWDVAKIKPRLEGLKKMPKYLTESDEFAKIIGIGEELMSRIGEKTDMPTKKEVNEFLAEAGKLICNQDSINGKVSTVLEASTEDSESVNRQSTQPEISDKNSIPSVNNNNAKNTNEQILEKLSNPILFKFFGSEKQMNQEQIYKNELYQLKVARERSSEVYRDCIKPIIDKT